MLTEIFSNGKTFIQPPTVFGATDQSLPFPHKTFTGVAHLCFLSHFLITLYLPHVSSDSGF